MDLEVYNAEKDSSRYSREFTLNLPPRITMSYVIEILSNRRYLENDEVHKKVLDVFADYLVEHYNELKQAK